MYEPVIISTSLNNLFFPVDYIKLGNYRDWFQPDWKTPEILIGQVAGRIAQVEQNRYDEYRRIQKQVVVKWVCFVVVPYRIWFLEFDEGNYIGCGTDKHDLKDCIVKGYINWE